MMKNLGCKVYSLFTEIKNKIAEAWASLKECRK